MEKIKVPLGQEGNGTKHDARRVYCERYVMDVS